jgi:CBS domain-containing protein
MPSASFEQEFEHFALHIGKAASPLRLRLLKDFYHAHFAANSDRFSRNPAEQNELFNRICDHMIRRAVRLAEAALEDKGIFAPCPYSFVLFGSGGRSEQTYLSDQDNGIVYDDPPAHLMDVTEAYFQKLSEQIDSSLQTTGFPPCTGMVVCSSSKWRRSVSDWNSQTELWKSDPTWEHIRYLLVLADIRPLYGSSQPAERVITHYRQSLLKNMQIGEAMLRNTLHHKPVIGPFGNVVKIRFGEHSGGIEIKNGVYLPIVNGIRLLSVISGVSGRSTLERIEQLRSLGVIPALFAERLRHDFASALYLRTLTLEEPRGISEKSSVNPLITAGIVTTGIIPAIRLTKLTLIQIKRCIHTAKRLQQLVMKEIQHR